MTYVDREVYRAVPDGLSNFLDDTIGACPHFFGGVTHSVSGKETPRTTKNAPSVSISRASILWNPEASSFI